jgi:RsiW-degrading membrane proteinase PrsW (M82 family)
MNTLLAFVGGILPPLIWLWFWLKEDSLHPEPKKYIFFTFIIGMITAILIIPIEKYIINTTIHYSLYSLFLLSCTEEISKYIFAYGTTLRKKITDEPIDVVIYMITVALGFAALENILYVWDSFENGLFAKGVIMTNMRFIGSTVLHTASSGLIGMAIALSFYKKKIIKFIYLIIGIILSIALHTYFNFSIINNNGGSILNVFIWIWVVIVILLFLFEKIKKIKRNKIIS